MKISSDKTGKSSSIRTTSRPRKAIADAAQGNVKVQEPTKHAKVETERDTGERGATCGQPVQAAATGEAMSLLDAAAHLLSLDTCAPMRCKDIVDLAIQRGLWAPRNGGKTPANSLHAAIQREIKTKDTASRFVKAERGKFGLALKA